MRRKRAVPIPIPIPLQAEGALWPHYFSTTCMHGLHDKCKGKCKFCEEKCRCRCHRGLKP